MHDARVCSNVLKPPVLLVAGYILTVKGNCMTIVASLSVLRTSDFRWFREVDFLDFKGSKTLNALQKD